MIKIHVKYKEIYSGLGNYYLKRIIKYKLPSSLFHTKKECVLAITWGEDKMLYIKKVDSILNNVQAEKENVKSIVLKDIEALKINSKDRRDRIKNAGFSMEINMPNSNSNKKCPHGYEDWDDCPDCRH